MTIPLDVYLMEETTSSMGGVTLTKASTPAVQGMMCSVQPLGGSEEDQYYRRQMGSDVRIYTHQDFGNNGLPLESILVDPKLNITYVVKAVNRWNNTRMRRPVLTLIFAKQTNT